MLHAIWVPLFGQLAEPAEVVGLAAEAEEHRWDGFFVWDHVAFGEHAMADAWTTLSAVAAVTESIALGPMVTALPRRRPGKVVRETVTLDRLSGGRLVLGVGIGSDRFGREYSAFGEAEDDRTRAAMLDESLAVLGSAWSGGPVRHAGEHHRVDDVTFEPRPVRGSIPVWVAGYAGNARPVRRAVRHDGYFPVNVGSPDQLAEIVATVRDLREDDGPYDVATELAPGRDPAPYVAAGATWSLTDLAPEGLTVDTVRGVIRDGPPV
jgi:alkanesulfonate monooxygenase SsuD/methylene tetrahydromethanopterin reductase-like flavin-dependent oxidoreductase (luciferase family)